MSRSAFGRGRCSRCGRLVSVNALAQASHRAKHAREEWKAAGYEVGDRVEFWTPAFPRWRAGTVLTVYMAPGYPFVKVGYENELIPIRDLKQLRKKGRK